MLHAKTADAFVIVLSDFRVPTYACLFLDDHNCRAESILRIRINDWPWPALMITLEATKADVGCPDHHLVPAEIR